MKPCTVTRQNGREEFDRNHLSDIEEDVRNGFLKWEIINLEINGKFQ